MSYNTQDALQIASITMSCVYLASATGIVIAMKKLGWKENKLEWMVFYMGVLFTQLMLIAWDDAKTLFTGMAGRPSDGKATRTEKIWATLTLMFAVTAFALYWGSVGMSLANGNGSSFTTANNTVQPLYIVGSVLIIIVVLSLIISMVHWARKWCGK